MHDKICVQFPEELADDMDTSEQDDRIEINVRSDIEPQDLMEYESKELDTNVRQTTDTSMFDRRQKWYLAAARTSKRISGYGLWERWEDVTCVATLRDWRRCRGLLPSRRQVRLLDAGIYVDVECQVEFT